MPTKEGENKPNVETQKGPETPGEAARRAAQEGKEGQAAKALAGAETPITRIEDARKAHDERAAEKERREKEAAELKRAGEVLGLGKVPGLEVVTRLTEIAYKQDREDVAKNGERLMKELNQKIQSGEYISEQNLDESINEVVVNMVNNLDAKQLTDDGIRSYLREELIPRFEKSVDNAKRIMDSYRGQPSSSLSVNAERRWHDLDETLRLLDRKLLKADEEADSAKRKAA